MLNIIKQVAGGIIVGSIACAAGKAIHLYGEKRYWQGKLVATAECMDVTVRHLLDKEESKCECQKETEEA